MTREMPKRLQPPAPPGALLKGITVPPRRTRAEDRKDDPDHLALIRQLPCLDCGLEPCGEAAHTRYSVAKFGKAMQMGRRVRDSDAVPLCATDHRLARTAQHQGREADYWEMLDIEPYAVARQLYEKRGDYAAMRAIVLVAIANRRKKR